MRPLAGAAFGLALTTAPAAAATPEELMAQLLVANDIAEICGHTVQRKGGRDANDLISDGVLMIINAYDVRMSDLLSVRNTVSPARMRALKEEQLTRRGVDLGNRKEVCFFARQIVSDSDPIGRYLEAR